MKHFTFYTRKDILALTRLRRFETKLGEKIQCVSDKGQLETILKASSARYAIFGISEDIGERGNLAKAGSGSVWDSFLSNFLNNQSSDFLDGEEILLLGLFNFSALNDLIKNNAHDPDEETAAWRHAVNLIDDEVETLVKMISSAKKIPIAIGGGQNNAYPLIKGSAKGLFKAGLLPLAQINCVNLDSKTGYGPLEGRHSGNAFRYADEDGYLQKYCVIGIHENELPQNVWIDIVNNPFVDFTTYEDIFIHRKRSFIQSIEEAAGFTDDSFTGIQLDLSVIDDTSANDFQACGLSPVHARQFIDYFARNGKVAFLNISEGHNPTAGKLISYMVGDFVKARS